MEDWCKWCVYADKDGADDPCFECESDNDGAPTRFAAKRKMLTNADKYFRNATDEELVELLAKQEYKKPTFGGWLPLCYYVMGARMCHENGCRNCWLDWLKQEVESDV